jgi:hypothetical protein
LPSRRHSPPNIQSINHLYVAPYLKRVRHTPPQSATGSKKGGKHPHAYPPFTTRPPQSPHVALILSRLFLLNSSRRSILALRLSALRSLLIGFTGRGIPSQMSTSAWDFNPNSRALCNSPLSISSRALSLDATPKLNNAFRALMPSPFVSISLPLAHLLPVPSH